MKRATLNISLFLLLIISSSLVVKAQLSIDAEIRPQYEYRHGFKSLFPDAADYASFVSQRTRLNTSYQSDKFKVYLSLQNARVWGDVAQLNSSDRNGIAIHEAYGEMFFTKSLSLKVGRQELVYDDHRILGNVNWAVQGRSHDIALLKFKKDKFSLDFGAALNQDADSLTGRTYLQSNNYNNLQMLWMQKRAENFTASFLFLNNGIQYIDILDFKKNDIRYSQTTGFHLKYFKKSYQINSNLYYQFGKDLNNNDLSAYLLGIEGKYDWTNKFSLALGGELQSGNDEAAIKNKRNTAFNPLYGTNHKFNGYMDYFYVGNHINSVGLLDIYLKSSIKIKEKSKIELAVHQFNAPAKIKTKSYENLGTEIDLLYTYTFDKAVNVKLGYSQMFAQKSMELLKTGDASNTNNFAYIILTFKPNLFNTNEKNK